MGIPPPEFFRRLGVRTLLGTQEEKARRKRTLSSPRIASGGSFCSNFVGNGSMNVKGPDLGLGLKEVPYSIVDLLILFMLISLSIFLFVPKAQGQNAIGVGVRDEHNLVHESVLLLQNWHRFFIDGVCKVLRFSWFAGHFN